MVGDFCEIFWIALFRNQFKESLQNTSSLTITMGFLFVALAALVSVHL